MLEVSIIIMSTLLLQLSICLFGFYKASQISHTLNEKNTSMLA
jgi:hypothetical protein